MKALRGINMYEISVIIPCFNEAGNIVELSTRLVNTIEKITKE
jgi:glycosyltransferase involved in cell wall biosynthesis